MTDRLSADGRLPAANPLARPDLAYPDLLRACPFAATVPASTEPSRRAELADRVAELGPWSQGPFPLAENLVVGVGQGDDLRWSVLGAHVAAPLTERRVLVVEGGAGYDAFAFAARGAEYVLASGRSDELRQAELLESVYQSGVEFRPAGWEALDPAREGSFDVVHCRGLLHRVLEPMTLLRTLRSLTASEGTLLIESMVLADPERSELLRFVPGAHAEDADCWFVPGRLAFRWMVEQVGFAVQAEIGETEGPRDGFPVVYMYLRATAERATAER